MDIDASLSVQLDRELLVCVQERFSVGVWFLLKKFVQVTILTSENCDYCDKLRRRNTKTKQDVGTT